MKRILLAFSRNIFSGFFKPDELDKILYAIDSLYINITKILFLVLLSYSLNSLPIFLILMLFFIPLRIFGFGFHAKNSVDCYIISTFCFVLLPILFYSINFSGFTHLFIFITVSLLFYKYAPMDTPKGLKVLSEKRRMYKIILMAIAFCYLLLMLSSFKYRNLVALSLLLEGFYITPISYNIFFNKSDRKD